MRAFARASEERNALVFAVGDATSREAQTIGFKNVRSASGNVENWLDLSLVNWTRMRVRFCMYRQLFQPATWQVA